MLHLDPDRIPRSFDAAENRAPAARDTMQAANVAEAKRLIYTERLGKLLQKKGSPAPEHSDTIVHYRRKAEHYADQATSLHAYALKLDAEHQSAKTPFEKIKPRLMQVILATAIAAEIISIPVLLMSCVMMTRPHGGAHQTAAAL